MRGIIWLASYPRSGNTWLRTVLTNLLSTSAGPIDVNQLEMESLALRSLFDGAVGWETSESTDEEIGRWRLPVQEIFAGEAPPVFKKTHDVFRHPLTQAPLFSPSATRCAIYIVRNPLDVAVSFKARFGTDSAEAVRFINDPNAALEAHGDDLPLPELLSDWSTHVRSWIDEPGLRVCAIRYEDMKIRPEETFATAFRFAGLTLDVSRLRKALEFSAFEVVQQQERRHGFSERMSARRFFREGRVGSGKELLSEIEVAQIVGKHADVMRRFGYLPTDFAR